MSSDYRSLINTAMAVGAWPTAEDILTAIRGRADLEARVKELEERWSGTGSSRSSSEESSSEPSSSGSSSLMSSPGCAADWEEIIRRVVAKQVVRRDGSAGKILCVGRGHYFALAGSDTTTEGEAQVSVASVVRAVLEEIACSRASGAGLLGTTTTANPIVQEVDTTTRDVSAAESAERDKLLALLKAARNMDIYTAGLKAALDACADIRTETEGA